MFLLGLQDYPFSLSVEIILEAKEHSLFLQRFPMKCVLPSLYDVSSSSAVEFDFGMEDHSLYSL